MKKQTIAHNIEVKLNEWLETISDISLREEVKNNLLVSGGCIASMFLNEPVNDYDVYLSNPDTVKNVADYYTKDIESVKILDGRNKASIIKDFMVNYPSFKDIDDVYNSSAIAIRTLKDGQIKLLINGGGGYLVEDNGIDTKYKPAYFSPNAISLTDNLQIVLRFHGNNEEIHKTFDFVHATNYFTFKEGLVTNKDAIESLLTKTLIYQGSLYPLTSIIRSKKFVKRGFMIGAGEYLKIMFQISQLNLTNVDVLEEQLIGVDVAYFDKLITILREHITKHEDFVITPAYLNAIIDKVFNNDITE